MSENSESSELADLLSNLVGPSNSRMAIDSEKNREKKLRELLRHRKLPAEGCEWDEATIEWFLGRMSLMDTNNYSYQVGVGEREGRVICPIVRRRHYNLSHGIGRSGDVAAIQPKAPGSSTLMKLGNDLVLHAIQVAGIRSCKSCFIVPMATGMALTLTLLALKRKNPDGKYVIWCRIDQKSCFKSIVTAGLIPLIIDPVLVGDELRTDIEGIKRVIAGSSESEILAIMTTTSCFAPRVPDSLKEVSEICQTNNIAHVVNNAYGLQSSKCCHLIEQSICGNGRLDVFVQSTDKNFLVPVGGAIIAGADKDLIDFIAKTYPGRASITPHLDTIATLLSLGEKGWKDLLSKRKDTFAYLKKSLESLAEKYNLKLLETKNNPISLALSLLRDNESESEDLTRLGSQLFARGITGARVVTVQDNRDIEGYNFVGWGSHHKSYPTPYINAAAAIGMKQEEVDQFIAKINPLLKNF